MADYDIDLSSLSSKQSDVEDLKTKAENVYNEFNSSGAFSDSELSGIKNSIKTLTTRLKKGHANSLTWYKNYLTELTDLENSLASFEATNLTAPTEFKGEFVDMFGKVTMPIIKTNGDTHANADKFTSTEKDTGHKTEDKIYNYLAAAGFNSAAICGILANMNAESSFDSTSYGDGGTSYGLCQWHNGRFTNLQTYCSEHNEDYKSVEGQLDYLLFELENSYPGVYSTLKNVPNTADGAYQAAKKWTVDFEIPQNKEAAGESRGATASSTYWDIYGDK